MMNWKLTAVAMTLCGLISLLTFANAPAALPALVATQLHGTVAQWDGKFIVRLTDVLGVEVQVQMEKVSYAEELFQYTCPPRYFLVEVGKGCYVAIPPSAFKEAHLEKGRHIVTLVNGKTVTGRLMGDLIEHVDDSSKGAPPDRTPRAYSLKGCTTLTIQRSDITTSRSSAPKGPQVKWQFTSQNTAADAYEIMAPRFSYYIRVDESQLVPVDNLHGRFETTTSVVPQKDTSSFAIDIAGEKTLATLSDFSEVSFKPGEQPFSTEVTLVSASGVKSSGEFLLKGMTGNDYDRYNYALIAEIDGAEGSIILVSDQGTCTIKKGIDRTTPTSN